MKSVGCLRSERSRVLSDRRHFQASLENHNEIGKKESRSEKGMQHSATGYAPQRRTGKTCNGECFGASYSRLLSPSIPRRGCGFENVLMVYGTGKFCPSSHVFAFGLQVSLGDQKKVMVVRNIDWRWLTSNFDLGHASLIKEVANEKGGPGFSYKSVLIRRTSGSGLEPSASTFPRGCSSCNT